MSKAFKGKDVGHPEYANLGYESIWKSVRAQKKFSRVQLVIHIAKNTSWKINDWTVKSYIQRLEKAGYLKVTGHEEKGAYVYELVNDCGVEAPRLRKDGSRCTQGRKQENLWRSMRMQREFNHTELAITASTAKVTVSEQTAQDFIKDLLAAGYLIVTTPGCKANGLATYRLVKNTGPKPPIIRRVRQVYDQNIKRIVWPVEEESA